MTFLKHDRCHTKACHQKKIKIESGQKKPCFKKVTFQFNIDSETCYIQRRKRCGRSIINHKVLFNLFPERRVKLPPAPQRKVANA